MLVVAVDPGIYGGIAIVGERYAEVHAPPVCQPGKRKRIDAPDLVRVLKRAFTVPEFEAVRNPPIAVVEYASSMPGEGAVGAFSYGCGYGVYIGALTALDVPPVIVTSRKWKGALGLSSDKSESLALARRLFPGFSDALRPKGSDGKAEALLLAYWARGCFRTTASAVAPVEQMEF